MGFRDLKGFKGQRVFLALMEPGGPQESQGHPDAQEHLEQWETRDPQEQTGPRDLFHTVPQENQEL